jgi:hypothetical protein
LFSNVERGIASARCPLWIWKVLLGSGKKGGCGAIRSHQ